MKKGRSLVAILKKSTQNVNQTAKLRGQADKGQYKSYLLRCPHCRLTAMVQIESTMVYPRICVHCGEVDPIFKAMTSLDKAAMLMGLASLRPGNVVSKECRRVLLEQCTVSLATCLEVFLKDMYALTLDTRYVKREKSLLSRFLDDGKNRFINLGSSCSLYKKDLGIDLKKLLGDEKFSRLNVLMVTRNVIVHNNGIIDKEFAQTGKSHRLKQPVPVGLKDSRDNVAAIKGLVKIVSKQTKKDFKDSALESINQLLAAATKKDAS